MVMYVCVCKVTCIIYCVTMMMYVFAHILCHSGDACVSKVIYMHGLCHRGDMYLAFNFDLVATYIRSSNCRCLIHVRTY